MGAKRVKPLSEYPTPETEAAMVRFPLAIVPVMHSLEQRLACAVEALESIQNYGAPTPLAYRASATAAEALAQIRENT